MPKIATEYKSTPDIMLLVCFAYEQFMYETKITTDVDIITFFKSNNFIFLKKNLSKKKNQI